MGLEKNRIHEAKRNGSTRGSVRNEDRLEAFAAGSNVAGADWGGSDPGRLQGVIVQITELGGAVTIGLSRDKGSHMLTLLLGSSRQTLWFNGDADLDEKLDEVAAKLASMV